MQQSEEHSVSTNKSEAAPSSDADAPTDFQEPKSKNNAPGVLGVFQSVLAAMFGVQSDEKREQDFEHGSVGNYIFVGIVMVIVFILTIVAIVNSVLESAGQ